MAEVPQSQSPVATAAPEVKRVVPQVNPVRFKQFEFVNTKYSLTVESNTTIEDVQTPEFWAHISQQLRPYDDIRIVTDDGSWYADVFVLVAARNWARVKVKYFAQLTTSDVDQSQAEKIDTHRVEYKGPHRKWSVIRNQDDAYLKDGMQTQGEAAAWLKEHLKAL